jgi:hypothetical protein
MYIGLWLLSAGRVSILLHPHCTPGPSPCVYKRKVQGPHTSGWSRGRTGHRTGSLSLSLTNACNPYCKRIRPGRRITRVAVLPPLCSISRRPIWAGTRSDNFYSSVQGPPGIETPTVGTPGRGLLRVDEQLPVELQMGSPQQPL